MRGTVSLANTCDPVDTIQSLVTSVPDGLVTRILPVNVRCAGNVSLMTTPVAATDPVF